MLRYSKLIIIGILLYGVIKLLEYGVNDKKTNFKKTYAYIYNKHLQLLDSSDPNGMIGGINRWKHNIKYNARIDYQFRIGKKMFFGNTYKLPSSYSIDSKILIYYNKLNPTQNTTDISKIYFGYRYYIIALFVLLISILVAKFY
jgi:hypothetical protein